VVEIKTDMEDMEDILSIVPNVCAGACAPVRAHVEDDIKISSISSMLPLFSYT